MKKFTLLFISSFICILIYGQIVIPGMTENFNDVTVINENTFFLVGDNGQSAYTTDGGLTWYPDTANTAASLNAVECQRGKKYKVAVGDNGTFLEANVSSGNKPYTLKASPVTTKLNDLIVTESWWGPGSVVVGDAGTILIRSRYGDVRQIDSGLIVNLNCVAANAWEGENVGPYGIKKLSALIGGDAGQLIQLYQLDGTSDLELREYNIDSLTLANIIDIEKNNRDGYVMITDSNEIIYANCIDIDNPVFIKKDLSSSAGKLRCMDVQINLQFNTDPIIVGGTEGLSAYENDYYISSAAYYTADHRLPISQKSGTSLNINGMDYIGTQNGGYYWIMAADNGTVLSNHPNFASSPKVDSSGSLTIISGGSVDLSDPNADNYANQWYRDGLPLSTAGTVNATVAGDYYYTRTSFEQIYTYTNAGVQDSCISLIAYSDTVTVTVTPATENDKIEDNKTEGVVMYPIPANEFINVELDKTPAVISICNLLGVEVLSENVNSSKVRLEVGDLQEGMYIVSVKYDKYFYSEVISIK